MDVLNYPGFPGVFLAVLFSGALRFVKLPILSTCGSILQFFSCLHVRQSFPFQLHVVLLELGDSSHLGGHLETMFQEP